MARTRLNSGNPASTELPKTKITRESLNKIAVLLKYIKPYRVKFTLGLLFLICATGFTLIIPQQLGSLMQEATESIKTGSFATVDNIFKILLIALFFIALFSFFRVYWFVEVAESAVANIRRDTYKHLITLPMDFFAQNRVGELSSRIAADLSQIQDTIATTLAQFIRQVIILMGGIIALCFVSVKLTLMILAVLPVLIIFAVFFGRHIRKLSRKAQDKLAESNVVVEETLHGIANVKAFVNESFEIKRYSKNISEVVQIALKNAKYRGAFIAFLTVGLLGTIVGVIWYGTRLVILEEINIGQLTTFILYSMFVGGAMGSFAELYAQLQKTVGASERVLELMHEENEAISITADGSLPEMSKTLTGNLTFNNVGFHYPGSKNVAVLQNVSFEAKKGERVALVGPSGAGKSTVASLVLRFYEPVSGNILFDGADSKSYSLNDIRGHIAIVPQDVLLFGGTIKENIEYGKIGASDEEIMQAAQRANAHNFIKDFPEAYDTIVGERGVKLSGGQRQRIAIARALLKNPAILVLDEATSSLDSESERLVQEALEELMKNRTSIIIAHRLSTIREADKIIVLDKGRVTETGKHQELLLNDGLYKHLNELQMDV